MPTLARLTRAVLVAALAALWAALPALAQSDADFIAARAAFEKGDRAKLTAIAPKLSGHVLAPYVEYWQLKLGLEEASPRAVASYLDRYPNTPLADRLRTDWLKLLGRKGLWSRFALDYVLSATEDLELACYSVLYKWQRDGDSALAAAVPLWFSGAATPDACDPAFTALIKRGDITVADRRARFRLANEAGNLKVAQAIGADLPGKERIPEREYSEVSRDPLRALDKGAFAWTTGGGQELALFALERAARSDAGAARSAWVKWRDRLPEGDRRYGNARLAYYAARQLHPNANEWFHEVADLSLTPDLAAWRVRAALRALRWDDALAAIDAMSEAQRQEAAWRYWRARALAARGRPSEANAALTALASETNFYGMLASEALGQRFTLPASDPLTPPPAALAAFAERPEVKRAVKLAELDMRAESQREWYYIVRGLDDDALLLAANTRPGRPLRSRDQHRRTHRGASRLRAALPDALPLGVRGRGEGAGRRRGDAVRHRAAGIPVQCRHRFVGRRHRPHAAHAGDGALGREADQSRRLPRRADRRRRCSTRSSARTISSTGWSASTGCRRSRPLRIMPGRDARRRGVRRRRSKGRSGSRRFPSTKPATT